MEIKGPLGFFDLDDRYDQLSKSGDPLERLSAVVNFEAFRSRVAKSRRGQKQPYRVFAPAYAAHAEKFR